MFCAFCSSISTPLAFHCVFGVYWLLFTRLCIFFHFWLLYKPSFSVSLCFCMYIGCPLAGCACFHTFGCSISTHSFIGPALTGYAPLHGCSIGTPLRFPCVFPCLLTVVLLVMHIWCFWLRNNHSFWFSPRSCLFISIPLAACTCYCTFGCCISTHLAFLHVFACLLATLKLVMYVLHFWFLNKHSFSVSWHFCLFIGPTWAGYECFCTFGYSISTPSGFPFFLYCWLAVLFVITHVFALLVVQRPLYHGFSAVLLVYWLCMFFWM